MNIDLILILMGFIATVLLKNCRLFTLIKLNINLIRILLIFYFIFLVFIRHVFRLKETRKLCATHFSNTSFTKVSSSSPKISVTEIISRNASKSIVFSILYLLIARVSSRFWCLPSLAMVFIAKFSTRLICN